MKKTVFLIISDHKIEYILQSKVVLNFETMNIVYAN